MNNFSENVKSDVVDTKASNPSLLEPFAKRAADDETPSRHSDEYAENNRGCSYDGVCEMSNHTYGFDPHS